MKLISKKAVWRAIAEELKKASHAYYCPIIPRLFIQKNGLPENYLVPLSRVHKEVMKDIKKLLKLNPYTLHSGDTFILFPYDNYKNPKQARIDLALALAEGKSITKKLLQEINNKHLKSK
jgi:hypothetical protein